jgi:hypothetical protein
MCDCTIPYQTAATVAGILKWRILTSAIYGEFGALFLKKYKK